MKVANAQSYNKNIMFSDQSLKQNEVKLAQHLTSETDYQSINQFI